MKNWLFKYIKYNQKDIFGDEMMPAWTRYHWLASYWMRRLDWPGVMAIGILVMCLAFYLSAIRPEQARIELAHMNLAALKEQLSLGVGKSQGKEMNLEDQLSAFYLKFPDEHSSPRLLAKLVQQARKNGLSLNDGEYKVARDTTGRLVRYQVTLKVNGAFPQIRQFLLDLAGALPVAGLESVQFQRQSIAEGSVDSRIKLILFMEQAS